MDEDAGKGAGKRDDARLGRFIGPRTYWGLGPNLGSDFGSGRAAVLVLVSGIVIIAVLSYTLLLASGLVFVLLLADAILAGLVWNRGFR